MDKKKLEVLLGDKETLLKEVHHRVKNNFAVILSFLEFQLMDTENENVNKTIIETKNRINTISIAHELIYGEFLIEKDYRFINLKKYIVSIASAIIPHGSSNKTIKINFDIVDTNLNIDTCLPIGILINELVTNSFKHVYRKQNMVSIDISIT